MKISELFEEEFMNTKLDRIMAGMRPKKAGQSDDVKARNAYSKGFRSAFSGTSTDTGVAKDFEKYVAQGSKDGKVEAKKHKDIPAHTITKNSYGDKKPNQAFEKIVKSAMAPYLEKFKA